LIKWIVIDIVPGKTEAGSHVIYHQLQAYRSPAHPDNLFIRNTINLLADISYRNNNAVA